MAGAFIHSLNKSSEIAHFLWQNGFHINVRSHHTRPTETLNLFLLFSCQLLWVLLRWCGNRKDLLCCSTTSFTDNFMVTVISFEGEIVSDHQKIGKVFSFPISRTISQIPPLVCITNMKTQSQLIPSASCFCDNINRQHREKNRGRKSENSQLHMLIIYHLRSLLPKARNIYNNVFSYAWH